MIDIDKIIKKMTVREKIGQLNLTSYSDAILPKIVSGEVGAILNIYDKDLVKQVQELALKSKHQIPLLIGEDVIHGFKTIFPVPLAEACSFNLDLIEKTAYISMLEARMEGINWIYAPMLDIITDPRFGRVMETSGEDPFLTSQIAQRKVRGIQQTDNNQITAACPKHYLGYGAVEAGLDYRMTDFSEYKMRSTYLPPFQAAIDEGALSIMHAFTTYNNLPVTINKYLLDDVLRKECEFSGILVTDWQCLKQLTKYQVLSSDEEAAQQGLLVGIDLDMHGQVYLNHLEQVISNNPQLLNTLDAAVRRILMVKLKMGLFNSQPENNNLEFNSKIRKHALQSANESIILFKNNNHLLPLQHDVKILCVGPFNSDQDIHLGAWACRGQKEDVISLRRGIESHFLNCQFFDTPLNTEETNWEKLRLACQDLDYIILALGEPRSYSGENNCRMNINLPFNQDLLIDFIYNLQKPIIGIVFAGRPLAITNLDEKADAIIWSFHLGCEAGNSLAKVLCGEVNPSAKTVITFPRELGQVPIYYNRYHTGRDELIHYVDGSTEPLYPFGFGLSYSKFIYHEFTYTYDKNTSKLRIDVTIENDSPYSGDEIIQVYAVANITYQLAPQQALIGFKKCRFSAYQKQKITLEALINREVYRDSLIIKVGPSSKLGMNKLLTIN